MNDPIITNAMLQAQDQERIAELERDLAVAQSDVSAERIKRECAERRLAAAETAALRTDAERLDWLEGELEREQDLRLAGSLELPRSLFRRNVPITRAAIDAATTPNANITGR
jgi:hypothetical protein